MSASTELLDLHAISLHPPQVDYVDGFDGMEAVIHYLKAHPEAECSYCVTDIGHNIRAVAFFAQDNLMFLTSEGEVRKHDTPIR